MFAYASMYTMGTYCKHINDHLQDNVTKVYDFYTNSKLAVNVDKRSVILITNKNTQRY